MTLSRPLRIGFFVTNFPKLSEIFLLNQALALQARGHEVHIHALRSPVEARVQPGTGDIPGERIHLAGMPAGYAARLAALPGLAARNRGRGVLACLDPVSGGAEALTLRHLYRLDEIGRSRPVYDVVHAQLGSVARQCALMMRLGRLAGPLVVSFRGSDLSRHLAWGMPHAYDEVIAKASFFLPVARRWIEPLVRLGCARERISHLPSGIPVAAIPVRQLDDWGEGEFPRIVAACRLERYKGIHHGLAAFREVLAVWPGATFDVFGDGPERTALTALAGRLGVGDRVRWHGASSHADVIAGVARSHLHWFTTSTGRDGRTEGVPNILKETQAAGLPAVAFDHPGVDEVVLPGETGLTVPEGDVAGLVAATLELAADGDLARRMGRLASERARAAFDLDRLTGRLEAVYRAAVDGDSLDPALLA